MNTIERVYKSVDSKGRQVIKGEHGEVSGIIAYPENIPVLLDDSNNIIFEINPDSLNQAYLKYEN